MADDRKDDAQRDELHDRVLSQPWPDTETPSHDRAPYSDPVAGGDPTAPGAPHEPGGEDYRQSELEQQRRTDQADTTADE
jgi:hypothetical protein